MGSVRFWDMASLDEVLAEAQRDHGGSAMTEIYRRFDLLIEKIVFSFTVSGATRDDLRGEARLALLRAVDRHQLGKPGFPRYAELTIRGAAQRWLRTWNSRCGFALDDTIAHPPAPPTPRSDWGAGDTADVVDLLPERQQHLLELRYFADAELSEIASVRGVSVSAVSQQLRTVHNVLRLHLAA